MIILIERIGDFLECDSGLSSQIDNYLKEREFNGAILVGKNDCIIIKKGYGMANFEHGVPNTAQTKYRIASISKQFTAVAILLLEEKELISVTDPISKYLADFPNGENITIHHLLTHSSGIPNFTRLPDFNETKGNYSSLIQTIDRFKYKPLEFMPGQQFNYCNSGYILLAHIIEVVSESLFEDFLTQNIFLPLNMKNTGHDNHKTILKNRAAGYEFDGTLVNVDFIDMSIPKGGGSLYSTVEDLYLWDQSLYIDRILSRNSLQKMYTLHIGDYGYGWFLDNVEINNIPRKRIYHSGGIFGFGNEFHRYVDNRVVVIMSANVIKDNLYPLSMDIATLLFEDTI